jgi:hypothetical protein
MSKCPDVGYMLPSAAKKVFFDYFMRRLEAASLDYSANPTYREIDALEEIYNTYNTGSWECNAAKEAYSKAVDEYERRYPLCFSNERQCAFRKGTTSDPDVWKE